MWRIILFAGLACVCASKKTIRPKSLGGDGQLKDRLRAKAKGWLREAKAAVSSDFEAALLKATRPDMAAPKPKHIESVAMSVACITDSISGASITDTVTDARKQVVRTDAFPLLFI